MVQQNMKTSFSPNSLYPLYRHVVKDGLVEKALAWDLGALGLIPGFVTISMLHHLPVKLGIFLSCSDFKHFWLVHNEVLTRLRPQDAALM